MFAHNAFVLAAADLFCYCRATMSDSEDENYVFYGTALQEEVESRAGQHSKALQDPSLTKSLPVWKQVRLLTFACSYCKACSSICNGSD